MRRFLITPAEGLTPLVPPCCPKEAHLIIKPTEACYSTKGLPIVEVTMAKSKDWISENNKLIVHIFHGDCFDKNSIYILLSTSDIPKRHFILGSWLLYLEFHWTQNRLFGQTFNTVGISHLVKLPSKTSDYTCCLWSFSSNLKDVCSWNWDQCLPRQQPAEPKYQRTDGSAAVNKPADDIHVPWEVLSVMQSIHCTRALTGLQMTLEPMLSSDLQVLRFMFRIFWVVPNLSFVGACLTSGKANIILSNTKRCNHFGEK